MKSNRLSLIVLLCATLFMTLFLAGCGKEDATKNGTTKTVTYEGQNYTVPANPQRIAVLSNSVLYLLDATGGTAIARVNTNDKLPEKLEALPALGQTANINMESLLGLRPDLVLGLDSQHSKYKDQLNSNHIPYILINYDSVNDNIPLMTLLGDITNHSDQAKQQIETYTKKVDTVKAAIKTINPAKVAVLRATGKGVTAETNLAITAGMVKDLGMNNVVLTHLSDTTKDKTVPYSLETLTQDNPDIIFIVTMGKEEDITKAMEKDMTSNPAWNHLKAVQNNKVIYLPSKLFLLNPGLQTPEAMARLVQDAYGITVDLK